MDLSPALLAVPALPKLTVHPLCGRLISTGRSTLDCQKTHLLDSIFTGSTCRPCHLKIAGDHRVRSGRPLYAAAHGMRESRAYYRSGLEPILRLTPEPAPTPSACRLCGSAQISMAGWTRIALLINARRRWLAVLSRLKNKTRCRELSDAR